MRTRRGPWRVALANAGGALAAPGRTEGGATVVASQWSPTRERRPDRPGGLHSLKPQGTEALA